MLLPFILEGLARLGDTETPLHGNASTRKRLNTETPLHGNASTRKRLYTESAQHGNSSTRLNLLISFLKF